MGSSVGLATELELAATEGAILDRGAYLVVRTVDPTYYLGNLLVLAAPPWPGEVARWVQRFTDEFADNPAIRHVAFRWDGTGTPAGAHLELTAAGFAIEDHWVMAADRITAARTAYPIRALAPDDMDAVAELGFSIADNHSDGYRRFLKRRAAWKADLVASRRARFWGAFDGDQLVGSLGLGAIDRAGPERARFQDVQTASTHRGRGIASTLLATAASAAEAARYVIVVEPGSPASGVYMRAGFTVIERLVSAVNVPAAR
ncbi:MAG TPA: GNAT family N-acetyltransferase [Kofleriaceae bacterium]|nr:GNAT family N-acetyltransferase [Kofleriaceae bacterium]